MRITSVALALILLTLTSAVANAREGERNRYKWHDAQGNLHFDDALPIEALQFGYDVVNAQGITVKHVERAKTEAELKADDEIAVHKAAERRAAEEQVKADQQTLAAYSTESELVASQQAQLSMLDQNVHATEVSLQSQEKSLTEMLSHAADLDRNGKPVPATLQSQIDTLRTNIGQQKAYIIDREHERAASEKRFEVELTHYRELRAKSQSH